LLPLIVCLCVHLFIVCTLRPQRCEIL
jgi:hypothetical protein